jgi:hypothetical protein
MTYWLKKDSRYILVEVDERQHFVKKQFHEDRNREKRFWFKYGNENAVIRIRVGDAPGEEMYSCISRTGGRGGGCSVKNSSMFSKNMNDIVKHIKDYFNKKNVIKHAYIEFFNNIGIQDFKKAFNHTKATITHESQYAFVSYPNELKIEEVTSKMEALSVIPLGKKIDCIKNRCKEKTSSKSGLCSKHR